MKTRARIIVGPRTGGAAVTLVLASATRGGPALIAVLTLVPTTALTMACALRVCASVTRGGKRRTALLTRVVIIIVALLSHPPTALVSRAFAFAARGGLGMIASLTRAPHTVTNQTGSVLLASAIALQSSPTTTLRMCRIALIAGARTTAAETENATTELACVTTSTLGGAVS